MWRSVPLYNIVLEKILDKIKKNNNNIRDDDLFKEVRNSTNYEVSYDDFLRALMALEIRGYISVSLIKENVRMITYLGDKE
ncbi:hypothetical protein SULI_05895 [Saccharolobus solfataricus]|nr:hypothetical protein [Saccharolobus solfataricus]AKA73503.1 hypothetical protein SULB_1194 [Saccharolobus solfataricus]AKA76201.1 hypothetical protein SULC_1192 [Saccharolobus solfataricus]AKA78893.1 hypothetical protein SULA_1193 [Saccharolobus solfataricus]AZF67972.1 hypothetical protein SULG_05895 [Saccharolobus solfataricus]AZF70592.1 hypothetical protein SULH_05895 [Saccharolobus solfataricus]